MKKSYIGVVALTVGAHFAFLIYLPSGGFVALRWPRTILLHVPMVVWGVIVVGLHLPCPLTRLEEWARARAGMDPLPTTGFIERYVAGVLYPADGTGAAQALGFWSLSSPGFCLCRSGWRTITPRPSGCTPRSRAATSTS